jgi:hypothetical protein
VALLIPVGVDIGQLHDPTAIAVIEPAQLPSQPHRVRRLRRLPLRMSYPQQAATLAQLLIDLHRYLVSTVDARPRVDQRPSFEVRMDVTGVGRPVYDLLAASLNRPDTRLVAVSLTSGQDTTKAGAEWHVPKNDLVSNLVTLVQRNRLQLSAHDPETPALLAELRDFRGAKTAADTLQTGARQGAHDDLVIALGLAALHADSPTRRTRVRDGDMSGGPGRATAPIARVRGGILVSTPGGEVEWRPAAAR